MTLSGYRLAQWARGSQIAPAGAGDGNEWADGWCALGCAQWTRVVAIGDASVPGLHFTLSACAPCIDTFVKRAWDVHLTQPATLRRRDARKTAVETARSGRNQTPLWLRGP